MIFYRDELTHLREENRRLQEENKMLRCKLKNQPGKKKKLFISITISIGNRTEWSPIRSVIIQVINKIGRPRSGSPICLITSMITDQIGRHEVLLPINHNFNKICDILGSFFLIKTQEIRTFVLLAVKKKPFKRARDGAYCPIT